MFARVTSLGGAPDRADQGISNFREQVLPAARQLAGFKGAYLMMDRDTGDALSVTIWESEEAMQASEEAASRLRAGAAQEVGATVEPTVRRYEVVVSEPPE
jgi:heme-degrading monooxygenase HmoA